MMGMMMTRGGGYHDGDDDDTDMTLAIEDVALLVYFHMFFYLNNITVR